MIKYLSFQYQYKNRQGEKKKHDILSPPARKTTVQTNPSNETERNSEIKPYLNATESNSARLPQVSLAELKVIQETLGDLERQGNLDLDQSDSWCHLAENQEDDDGGDLSSHHVTLDLANRIVQSYTGIQADLKYGVSGILSEIMDLVQDVVTSSEAGEDGLELPDFYKDTDSVSRSLDLMGAPTSKRTDEHQTDPSSWSLEGQPRFFQTRRRFSKWKGKSSKHRSRVQPSTAETDSASDLSSETDRFLRALLTREPNAASSGNLTERSNGASVEADERVIPSVFHLDEDMRRLTRNLTERSDGASVEDDERVIPSVFHLDEDMRRQIENIDVLLGQDPKETRVDELKCSDSDSDVELLDMATRKFLKKIQNKRLRRKRGLGFYLRKLKLLDTQIQNIIEGKTEVSLNRSRVQPSTAETDSASDLSSETDRFLRALLTREPNAASSGNLTERSDGASVEDDERVIPSVFHLDEDMRRQIENIDILLGQDPKETRVDELKCSDSDSDVELLDMATRKFLKKIQNKRLRRKRGLGFYLRKLKLLDTQIQNIIEGKDTSTNVLSEEDWNYLLSKPGDELSGDKEEDNKEGGNGKEDAKV
ncbi:uncharacterized protein LOC113469214 [Diaphorina citri]|uniref:Uncharacterized protein LOC113469214 n=1 Tax=Diaphorina citri TaxID=121845 RepID=A0A3Q0J217_DIACI|nr:uncharacterized protein LOC113469214 [Diaphorina citri]